MMGLQAMGLFVLALLALSKTTTKQKLTWHNIETNIQSTNVGTTMRIIYKIMRMCMNIRYLHNVTYV